MALWVSRSREVPDTAKSLSLLMDAMKWPPALQSCQPQSMLNNIDMMLHVWWRVYTNT